MIFGYFLEAFKKIYWLQQVSTEHIHIPWTDVIDEGWISAQEMRFIMCVKARNLIYDVSLVVRKYLVVHLNEILYYQAVLWG